MFFPLAMLSQYVFGPALFLISLFIVLIILLQRGRGGGLTGALGGAGGASAFGVKAGDIFTRITAVSVLLWIVLCALTCFWYLPVPLDIEADPGSMSSGIGDSSGLVLPSEAMPDLGLPTANSDEKLANPVVPPFEMPPTQPPAETSVPAGVLPQGQLPDTTPAPQTDVPATDPLDPTAVPSESKIVPSEPTTDETVPPIKP